MDKKRNKMKTLAYQDKAINILKASRSGMCTEELSEALNLSNRQIGHIMAQLSRKGKVITYSKGYVVKQDSPGSSAYKMRISNSYYQVNYDYLIKFNHNQHGSNESDTKNIFQA